MWGPWLAGLLTICWQLGSASADCYDQHLQRPVGPPGYMDQFKYNTRAIPPAHPPLSSSDWDLTRKLSEPPNGWPNLSEDMYWGGPPLAVKIYKRVLYASWLHDDKAYRRDFWHGPREVVLEQIFTAMWIYTDFPDIEFVLNPLDSPLASTTEGWDMPFLQFSVFNTTSHVTGRQLPIWANHTIPTISEYNTTTVEEKWCKGHSRGFAIPHSDAWIQISTSPEQLQFYSYCLHRHHGVGSSTTEAIYLDQQGQPLGTGGLQAFNTNNDMSKFLQMHTQSNWAEAHEPVAWWRGTNTGGWAGWEHQVAEPWCCRSAGSPAPLPGFLKMNLLNKRVAAVMNSEHHPWMDVRMSDYLHVYTPGWTDSQTDKIIDRHLRATTVQPQAPLEHWSRYQLTLSFDGHGPPYRLPRQLMSMNVVMRVESIFREWFSHFMLPGVHYAPLAFDLRDLTTHTHSLLAEAKVNSTRLQRMAIAARDLGVERFHLLAQLDATMWSIMRIKEICNYTVQPPNGGQAWSWGHEAGWVPFKLQGGRHWMSPGLRNSGIGRTIEAAFTDNFG